jgi:hypothetical protein
LNISNILNKLKIGSYNLQGKLEAFISSYGIYSSKGKRGYRRQYSGSSTTSVDAEKEHRKTESISPTITTIPPPTKLRSDSTTSVTGTNDIILLRPTRRRTSSLGDLSEPSSRALLLDFVSALNETFPDYDFADSKIDQFREVETSEFMRMVNNYLAEVTLQVPGILEEIWRILDEIIDLRYCEVFSFIPDNGSDDEKYANLWEFHYFLFNKDLDKLIYFCYRARR